MRSSSQYLAGTWMWYYGLASYSDSRYYTVWYPQQDSQRSDVVAAYTGISTHRAGSTMTTGMTITLSIKVITITDNSCHISPSSQSLWRPNLSACTWPSHDHIWGWLSSSFLVLSLLTFRHDIQVTSVSVNLSRRRSNNIWSRWFCRRNDSSLNRLTLRGNPDIGIVRDRR